MRVALIVGNVVENVAVYNSLPTIDGVVCFESDTANIGDGWNGTTIVPVVHTPPTPTAAQQAAEALAAGLIITSIGDPELNGTYALNQLSQNQVNATVTYILLNGTFPGGGSTMPWIDQNGSPHVWPSVAAFKLFATAFADYVAAVTMYAMSGSGSLPSNEVKI